MQPRNVLMRATDFFCYLNDNSMAVIKFPFKLKTVSYSTMGAGGCSFRAAR